MSEITVIICTHNPDWAVLDGVLAALRHQSLDTRLWDLVVCDSASATPVSEERIRQSGPAESRVVRATEKGLALARRTAANAATGRWLAILDDYTVPAPNYLEACLRCLQANPGLGSLSARIRLRLPVPEPDWLPEFAGMLARHEHGDHFLRAGPFSAGQRRYPAFAPLGVCVCSRLACLDFFRHCDASPIHYKLGRSGNSLASGEDNDFTLWLLSNGHAVAYLPDTSLEHVIPLRRLDPAYLARLNRAMQRTWMQVLALHDANPWPPLSPWSARLRILKAWFTYRPWSSPVQRIRYEGACGHFEGRSRHLGDC